MQKVLIADDEAKICQLIQKLVDWKNMDMKVVAVAHNGIEALELIQEKQPDIVITDIRMPGLDGLEMIQKAKKLNELIEFIIISGYRHFEYAQSAIRYGVNDYLLKPIKKEELNHALSKMHEAYLQRTEQLTFEEKVLIALKDDKEKVRTGFFSRLLYPRIRSQMQTSLEEINSDYHYRFQEGIFQIICIKLDGVGESYHSDLEFLADKIRGSIETNLMDCCYEVELYFENSRSYCLLNYKVDSKYAVRKALKAALNEIALQSFIFEQLKVTMGLGVPVAKLEIIKDSIQTAVKAMENRLLLGTERVIEGTLLIEDNITDSDWFREFNRKMNVSIESLNIELVSDLIRQLQQDLLAISGITGHEILQMTKEVCNVYLLSMRNHQITVVNADYFMEEFNIQANGFYQLTELFSFLENKIITSLRQAAEEKRQLDKKPIRMAKQYIQQNFNRMISLEMVSQEVGFNPTYFSSLFKKETGRTFLEYVLEIRMDYAKKLLRETNDSIAVICELVGYSDVKHFTKNFVKTCGIKPTEYRKLYS